MKIRSLLIVASLTLIISTSAMGVLTALTARRVETLNQQSVLAGQLMRSFFDQNITAQEYVMHREDRPKKQWYLINDEVMRILASPVLQDEANIESVRALEDGARELRTIFDQLTAQVGSSVPNTGIETQIAGDLLVRSSVVSRIANDMARDTTAARVATRRDSDRAVLTMLLMLVVLATAILAFLYKRIIGSLSALQKAVGIISTGDLDHPMTGGGNDEIGELSRAFDAMTSRLKESYSTMERKVQDRTKELREANERSGMLLRSMGDGAVAIDREWRITLWNPAATRITGWEQKDALGKPFREVVRFIREHDRKENLTFIEEVMLYGETKDMDNNTLLIRKDGKEIPVGDSAAPMLGENGEVAGAIIVFRDATKEKEATLLRTDFAYASHQLKTPVNRALWSLEMLQEDIGEEHKDKLKTAHKSLKDIARLSERLLLVSKIDQGLVTVKSKETSMTSLLKEVVKEAEPHATEMHMKVVLSDVSQDIVSDVDPALLTTALAEIIGNAIMYGGKDGRIEVGLEQGPGEIMISVKDHGIGIEEEQKPLVFTKFFRGQNISDEAVGAGLGLFIAREHVRLLGGKIWFDSTKGEGTTFTIVLPVTGRRA